MNKDETTTALGKIRIHRDVIASIASIAAMEVEGVKCIGDNFKIKLLKLLGRRSPMAVKVNFEKNDEVRLEIPIIIKYNFSIPEVASKVQENIRLALEKMTNIYIKDITVNIQGIEKE